MGDGFMTRYSVGDHVTIRYGKHQGKKATIMTSHPMDSYKVKVENGLVLFFSSKGLERKAVGQDLLNTSTP